MRLRNNMKRTTKQYIIVALICIVIIGSAAMITAIATIGQIRNEYEYMLSEAKQEMQDNKQLVYIALSDILTGEVLTMDKVEQKTVYSSQPSEVHITKNEIGKAVMIDIPKGAYIVKSMLTESLISTELREVEYDVIHISPNIMANDYIDVRIVYPNGENYIVMSKKPLKGFQEGTPLCYIWVNEEELLRMSAAIVDAALYNGSKIFATKYIEPNIQEASIITYTPNISVLSMIENDPNIVARCSQLLNKELRKALENRLTQSLGLDVSTISWEISDYELDNDTLINNEDKIDKDLDEDKIDKDLDEDKIDKSLNEDNKNEADIENKSNVDIYNEAPGYFPELGNKGKSESCYLATEG